MNYFFFFLFSKQKKKILRADNIHIIRQSRLFYCFFCIFNWQKACKSFWLCSFHEHNEQKDSQGNSNGQFLLVLPRAPCALYCISSFHFNFWNLTSSYPECNFHHAWVPTSQHIETFLTPFLSCVTFNDESQHAFF